MLELEVHGYFGLVFISELLVSATYNVAMLALQCWHQQFSYRIDKVQKTTPELYRLVPVIYCDKCEDEFLEYYDLLSFFFRSGPEDITKTDPTKKQIKADNQATLKHVPTRKLTDEKM